MMNNIEKKTKIKEAFARLQAAARERLEIMEKDDQPLIMIGTATCGQA